MIHRAYSSFRETLQLRRFFCSRPACSMSLIVRLAAELHLFRLNQIQPTLREVLSSRRGDYRMAAFPVALSRRFFTWSEHEPTIGQATLLALSSSVLIK
jgi:hypothetical protein